MPIQEPNVSAEQGSVEREVNLAPALRNTVVLQCLAAISIANSHLEDFYPHPWMAADGLLGNSMFFLLSGYGLMCSEQKHSRPFLQYYGRRVLRIYPSLFLTMLIFQFWLQGAWRVWFATDYLRHFIYPTVYEYIRQIMAYYVAFYFLAKLRQPRVFLWAVAALCLPDAWYWWTDVESGRTASLMLGALSRSMRWVFFFQVMLLGGWLATQEWGRRVAALKRPWLMLGICFGAYVALKYAMVKGVHTPWGLLFNFFPILHLFTVAIILLAFGLATAPTFLNTLKRVDPLYWTVSLIGGLTLEIYMVHEFVFRNQHVIHIVFPLNVIVFFVISICLSWGVAKAANLLRRCGTALRAQ